MNICLVSRELYPFQKAGIGVYINNLSRTLARYGNKVYIITNTQNKEYEYEVAENIYILQVKIGSESVITKKPWIAYSLAVSKVLKHLIEEVNIDVVEFCDYFGEAFFPILLKKNKGIYNDIPFVIKLHTPTYECRIANNQKDIADDLTFQEDYALVNSDYVYSISKCLKKTIENRLNIENIQVRKNIIEISQDKMVIEQEINFKYILYVGRIEKRKGIDQFIKVANRYLTNENDNKLKFIIVGNDVKTEENKSYKQELISSIPSQYVKHFIWLDAMNQEKLIYYYTNAYLSIFPSIYEGFGNVCVEAMQCGSPVLVSSDTGLEEIVQNGKYGLCYKNGDINDLYEKMKYVIEHECIRDKFKYLSTIRGEMFRGDNLYLEQINYYSSVIEDYKKKKKGIVRDYIEEMFLQVALDSNENIVDLINELQETRREQIRLISEWEKGRDDIRRLQNEYKSLSNITEELRAECIARSREENRVLLEWEKGRDDIQRLQSEYESLNNITEEFKAECIARSREENRVLLEWEKGRNEIQRLQNEYSNLQSITEQLRAECIAREKEENRVLLEWEKSNELNERLKKECDRLEDDLSKAHLQIDMITKKKEKIHIKYENIQQQVEELNNIINMQRETIEILNSNVSLLYKIKRYLNIRRK